MDLRSQVAGPVQRISGVFESKCGHPPDRMQGQANKLKIIVMKVTRGALVLGATMATVKHEQLPFKTCDYYTTKGNWNLCSERQLFTLPSSGLRRGHEKLVSSLQFL